MVKVSWKRLGDRRYEFRFEGHAGFSRSGSDIVCAAVSALFLTTMNSIEKFTPDKPAVTYKKDEVTAVLDITNHDTEILLDSMMLGLKQIQEEYGEEYLSLSNEEV